jgi:hypothetical protein
MSTFVTGASRCLPPEVWSLVFAQMDTVTLLSSCRVCKAWLAMSRPPLYAVMSFGQLRHLTEFLDSLPSIPKCALDCVRSLHINNFLDHISKRSFVLDLFPKIFVNVTELALIHVSLVGDFRHTLGADVAFDLLSKYHKVTVLTIDNTRFASYGQFMRFIVSFPLLVSLFVGLGCRPRQDTSDTVPPPSFPPLLRRLTIEETSATIVTDWLLANAQGLTYLNILWLNGGELLRAVGNFLETPRDTLKHLSIHLGQWPAATIIYKLVRPGTTQDDSTPDEIRESFV